MKGIVKKIISIIVILIMIFSVVSINASADEIVNTPEIESIMKQYWKVGGMVKIGDWYFVNSRISSTKEKVYVAAGYDGDKSDITVPVEANGRRIIGLYEFRLLSNSVKTLRIPKEITKINFKYNLSGNIIGTKAIAWLKNTSFEEIIVEEGNPSFSSKDGVLFGGDIETLILYPPKKNGDSYVVPETVKYIGEGALYYNNLKSITITENVERILPSSDTFPFELENLYYKNVKLTGETFTEEFEQGYRDYIPEFLDCTIHVVKDSPMHKFYEENQCYNKIEILPQPTKPKKAKITNVSYSSKEKAVKIEVEDQKCSGIKIYRYSEKNKKYEYLGKATDGVYYDKTAKKSGSYKYKARAYNEKNLMKENGEYSAVVSYGEVLTSQKDTVFDKTETAVSKTESVAETTQEPIESVSEAVTEETEKPATTDKKGNSNPLVWVVTIMVIVAAGGTVGFIFYKKRR